MDSRPGPSISNQPQALRVEGRPKPTRRWPWVVASLILLLLVVGGVIISRQHPKAPVAKGKGAGGMPPAMVTTATTWKGDMGVYVTALGVVTPVNTVAIKTRVDGQLVKIHYHEGQVVHQGDPLAEIDPGPYEAALTQAEGQLARDTALLENAKVDLERYKEAFSKNAIPKQQLDTQTASVHQYEGAVKLDEGQIANAKVQLAYCHITAPISGRVGLRLADAGNIVRTGDTNPLVIIAQFEPITVVFGVAEDNLPQIEPQVRQGKELVTDAYDRAQLKKLGTGTLLTLDNQIDTGTGTIKLKAIFPNKDNALFPNQFVNVRLLVDTHHDITLAPNPVIQRNSQGAFVYLVKPDQTVSIHPVTLGPTDGNITEVGGLEAGAVVAADNFNRLLDGAKIVPRPAGDGQGRKGGSGAPGKGKGARGEGDGKKGPR